MESTYVYHKRDGVKRTSIVDTDRPNELRVKTEIDMTATLENIKVYRDLQDSSGKTNWKHVARIPMTVWERAELEGWDDSDWKKWLNDPDNAAFRIWQGRV